MAFHFLCFLLLVAGLYNRVDAQSIYINQVSGYSQLPSCAEVPLSVIVRDMVSGCGDDGHTTSYSCFCSTSFVHFESCISTAVASTCSTSATAAVGQALQVFDNYCRVSYTGKSLLAFGLGKFQAWHSFQWSQARATSLSQARPLKPYSRRLGSLSPHTVLCARQQQRYLLQHPTRDQEGFPGHCSVYPPSFLQCC
jgi:hypothetical protein